MSHAQSHAHPQVTGNWFPADKTKNTLERAWTAEKGMLAVRSSHDSDDILYTTPGQIKSLAQAMQAEKIPE